jgi:ketosteroid isomerase-like protein
LAQSPGFTTGQPTAPIKGQDMTDAPTTNIDLVRALIGAVDKPDHDTIAALTAKDVHFRFGNADPTNTQSELLAAARSFRDAIADLHHTFVNVWEVNDGTVIATMDVNYRRLDGRGLTLPCCNVFRVRDGLVDTYLIYMDVNPVFAT